MRISPIFVQANRTSSTSMGQAFQKNNYRKSQNSIDFSSRYNNKNDIFMRLAEASMRDTKIELELKSMGLI